MLVFVSDDRIHGQELWKSDGTAAGAALVTDIAPGTISSNPEDFTVVGTNLFFSADVTVHGRELWVVLGGR